MWERHLAVNVIRFMKRRSRPKGGGGVSAPLPSCTFHGLRGKRAKRAPHDTVCYPKSQQRRSLYRNRSSEAQSRSRSGRHQANPARQSAPSTGRILDEAHPISAAFGASAGADPYQREVSCRYPPNFERCHARAGFASTGGPTSVIDSAIRLQDRSRLELRLPEPTARRPRSELPDSPSRRIPADRQAP